MKILMDKEKIQKNFSTIYSIKKFICYMQNNYMMYVRVFMYNFWGVDSKFSFVII